jgi:hypothetical protein
MNFVERDSKFYIENHTKILTKFQLPANSSIFLNDKNFVKTGDLIAELPVKNQQTIDARRNIYSATSGEIFMLKKSNQACILEGNLFNKLCCGILYKLPSNIHA